MIGEAEKVLNFPGWKKALKEERADQPHPIERVEVMMKLAVMVLFQELPHSKGNPKRLLHSLQTPKRKTEDSLVTDELGFLSL